MMWSQHIHGGDVLGIFYTVAGVQRDGKAMTIYHDFLKTKRVMFRSTGVSVDDTAVHPLLFDFQRDLTLWAARKGRAAVFADTGLGKTFVQVEWARLIGEQTLIIAPLSVARQTVHEAKKIDLDVIYVRSQTDVANGQGIYITNYEMIDDFDFSQFGAVVLDESSRLKSIGGKTRKRLTKLCQDVPYRLCCTATPAPNDYIELGNHAEFLGVCTRAEMLAMFFINANKEHTFFVNDKAYWRKGSNKGGQEWRLKHHAEQPFFQWLSTWAMALTKPSDLGYDDDGFVLPELRIHPEFVDANYTPNDQLFFTHIKGIKHASDIRRQTAPQRLSRLEELVNADREQWVIWCGLNEEQKLIEKAFSDDCASVYGSLSLDEKIQRLDSWLDKEKRILISKPSVLGFGLNLQQASKMIFFGLNYSWEQYYQCIRRVWRYLQECSVDVHIIMSDVEAQIYNEIMRKDLQARRLREGLIEQVKTYEAKELGMDATIADAYAHDIEMVLPEWLVGIDA